MWSHVKDFEKNTQGNHFLEMEFWDDNFFIIFSAIASIYSKLNLEIIEGAMYDAVLLSKRDFTPSDPSTPIP